MPKSLQPWYKINLPPLVRIAGQSAYRCGNPGQPDLCSPYRRTVWMSESRACADPSTASVGVVAGGQPEGDPLGCQRQLDEPQAGRVLDRIGNCRRGWNDRRLTDPASTEWTLWRGHLDHDCLDVRQIGRGQLAVIEQAGVGQPSLIVVQQPLTQREAEALHRTTLHLPLDAERVDGFADVLGDDEV